MGREKGAVPLRISGSKFWSLLIWFLGCGVVTVFVGALYWRSSDPACVDLVAKSRARVFIPLPPDCRLATTMPADDMVRYLESDRKSRGLVRTGWIVCGTSGLALTREFPFERDPRWLPTYVARGFQFRRTVVILPGVRTIPGASSIAGEVCLMPWRQYLSLVSGQCSDKFSVWK